MPICESCGEEAEAVYKCRVCGLIFCADCGYPEEGICDICEEDARYDEEGRKWTGIV